MSNRSEYIRENIAHSYGIDDLDTCEDVYILNEVSERHRAIHDPHIEVHDPDTDEAVDIGTEKFNFKVNKEYNKAADEEYKINRGNWHDEWDDDDDNSLPRSWDSFMSNFRDSLNIAEDDDE